MITRREIKHLVATYLISYLLRIIYLALCNFDYPHNVQGYYEKFAMGDPFASAKPLYPLFLKLVYGVAGTDYATVIIFQSLLTALIPILVYLISREMNFSKLITTIATVVVMVHPLIIMWSNYVMTEGLYMVFLLSLIYIAIKYINTNNWVWLLTMLLVGFSGMYLRRITLFIYIAMFGVLLVMSLNHKRYLHVGLIIILLLFTLIPLTSKYYDIVSYKNLKEWSKQWDSEHHAHSNYSLYDKGEGFKSVNNDGKAIFESLIDRLYYYWAIIVPRFTLIQKLNNIVTLPILYFGSALAILLSLRDWRTWIFLSVIGTTSFIHMITFVDYSYRYRAPLIPVLIILSAYGCVYILSNYVDINIRGDT